MNLAKTWSTALGTLQMQMPRSEYNTWLQRTTLMGLENGIATIGTPSTFYKEGLENRYTGTVRETLSDIIGTPIQVRVVIASQQPARVDYSSTREQSDPEEHQDQTAQLNGNLRSNGHHFGNYTNGSSNGYTNGHTNGHSLQDRLAPQQLEFSSQLRGMLNPKYTFERFIVGSSNRLANAACLAVAEHPAMAYNPLFLYGGVGLGKTHLLHAIGNYALDRDPEINVLYVSSEKFTNDLINSIRRQQTEEFRIRYRNIDILLIDDIQFIAGKESTQEEFFHTFNHLHALGKQIVISSDRPPKAILTLEERLRSRFEWGLIVDVQLPDLETRTAILRAKAEQLSSHVAPEVIDFLAQRIQSNIRELEGSLNRVAAYAHMHNTNITISVATSALSELLDTTRRKRITPEVILRQVADFYSVDLKLLQGRSRSRNIVVPRHVAMYLLREETDSSLVDIGQLLGGRDHTTVMYGYEKVEKEIETDQRLRQEIMTIREKLYQGTRDNPS